MAEQICWNWSSGSSSQWKLIMWSSRTIGNMGRRLRIVTVLCFLLLPGPLAGAEGAYNVVDRSEVLEAMRQHGDYDPTATTNGARFQAEAVFYLARQARERNPDGPPLFIGYEDWFRAFLAGDWADGAYSAAVCAAELSTPTEYGSGLSARSGHSGDKGRADAGTGRECAD